MEVGREIASSRPALCRSLRQSESFVSGECIPSISLRTYQLYLLGELLYKLEQEDPASLWVPRRLDTVRTCRTTTRADPHPRLAIVPLSSLSLRKWPGLESSSSPFHRPSVYRQYTNPMDEIHVHIHSAYLRDRLLLLLECGSLV